MVRFGKLWVQSTTPKPSMLPLFVFVNVDILQCITEMCNFFHDEFASLLLVISN